MPTLNGWKIALLEARLMDETAALVRRMGGIPVCAPAVREAPRLGKAATFIDAVCSGGVSLVIFLTGAGVTALLQEAERLGKFEQTLEALRKTPVACRGPKPVAVLGHHKVPVTILAAEPYTTATLLAALESFSLQGALVALVHYGERNASLADALAGRGARLEEAMLYEWMLPEDIGPLRALVGDVIAGQVDAVAFTSQIQCRHLFQVADAMGCAAQLTDALNQRAVVAAVGPVCAAALRGLGVDPDVVPERPKLGPMMAALAEYIERADSEP